jgi:hypothetical protein
MSIESNINGVPSITFNKMANPGRADVRCGVDIRVTDWRVGPIGPEAVCDISAGGMVTLKEEPGWAYLKHISMAENVPFRVVVEKLEEWLSRSIAVLDQLTPEVIVKDGKKWPNA